MGTAARCDCGLVTRLCAPSREMPRPGSAPSSWPGVPGPVGGSRQGLEVTAPLGGSLGAGAASASIFSSVLGPLVLPQDSGGTSGLPSWFGPRGAPSPSSCCHCLISDFLSPNPLPTPQSPNTHTSPSELILTSLPVQEPKVGVGTPAGTGHPGGQVERDWQLRVLPSGKRAWGLGRVFLVLPAGSSRGGVGEGTPVLPGGLEGDGLSRAVEADGSPDGGTEVCRATPGASNASLVLTLKPGRQTEMGALKGGSASRRTKGSSWTEGSGRLPAWAGTNQGRILSLHVLFVWDLCLGSRPQQWGRFSSTSGLYPLRTNSNPPIPVITQNVSRHCHMSPGGHDCPRLRTTEPGEQSIWAQGPGWAKAWR